jgi:hypothetical protein
LSNDFEEFFLIIIFFSTLSTFIMLPITFYWFLTFFRISSMNFFLLPF